MSDHIYRHKTPARWNPVFTFPALVSFKDKNGKTHNPPLPPRVNGLLPWESESGKFPRKRPLKNCPNLGCRRQGHCIDKINDKFCRKDHLTADQMREALVRKINRINDKADAERKARGLPPLELDPDEYDDGTPGLEIRYAFVARIEELHLKALHKWQKQRLKSMEEVEAGTIKAPPI